MPFPIHKHVCARQGMDFNITKTIVFDNDPSDLSEGRLIFLSLILMISNSSTALHIFFFFENKVTFPYNKYSAFHLLCVS